MQQEEKLIKDIECASCENIFDCKGKPEHVKRCLCYVERKKEKDKKRWLF